MTGLVGRCESKARAVDRTCSMPARCALGREVRARRRLAGRAQNELQDCGARFESEPGARRAGGEKGSRRVREGGFSGPALRLRSAVAFWRQAGCSACAQARASWRQRRGEEGGRGLDSFGLVESREAALSVALSSALSQSRRAEAGAKTHLPISRSGECRPARAGIHASPIGK
jgi:hypothetical protein